MTSRDLVIRTLNHQPPDRIPRDLWTLPGIRMFRQDELDRFLRQYPMDFASPIYQYGHSDREKGTPNILGQYTDAWGCRWHVTESGVVGEVKEHPLCDWSNLYSYKPPYEILQNADFTSVNKSCADTHKFVLSGCSSNPFERAQFLRGPEALYIDLAYGLKEVRTLLDLLHDFFVKEISKWADTDVDGVQFMDDWGAQNSLLISPDMWRDYFKPLYKDYCDIIHAKDKFAFFHSDGFITPIIPDLIEIGIDALNSQLFCMDIGELGERFRGKITFWGEIDRQQILPFGTTDEVKSAVRRVRNSLDRGDGGVIAQCEWGLTVPYENIAAVFDEWQIPST